MYIYVCTSRPQLLWKNNKALLRGKIILLAPHVSRTKFGLYNYTLVDAAVIVVAAAVCYSCCWWFLVVAADVTVSLDNFSVL